MSMRKCALIGFIGFMAIAAEAAVGEYRTFHDSQGREIKARLLQFNPQTDEVKIQLSNRKIRTAPISVFAAAAQDAIRNWHISEVVFSEKKLMITINKKAEGSERRRGETDGWTPKKTGIRVEEVGYELKLENRNKMALKGMKVEYRIYSQSTEKGTEVIYEYDQIPSPDYDKNYEELAENGNIKNKRSTVGTRKIPTKTVLETSAGEFAIPELPNKGRHEELTKRVFLREGSEFRPLDAEEDSRRRTHKERKVEGKLVGVIFRVSMPLASGGYARKEYAYPKDLLEKKKVDWDALKPEPAEEGEKEKESASL